MGFGDSIVGIVIIVVFLVFVWSKIYGHEKEHLDPMIEKIKGWFHKDESSSEGMVEPGGSYELGYQGI